MALSTDVLILGSYHRGLWLAREIQRLGWSVMWVQVKEPTKPAKIPDFAFDDWAFQAGPGSEYRLLSPSAQEFVTQVFRPSRQEQSLQVLTPGGPFEIAGTMKSRALRKFLPRSQSLLESVLDQCHKAAGTADNVSLKKTSQALFERPLGERWIMEWLGHLNVSRDMDAKTWFSQNAGKPGDPYGDYLLLDDALSDITERGVSWAERGGVKIKRHGKLADIGEESGKVTGIELAGADGFISCKYLINTMGTDTLAQKAQRFSQKLSFSRKDFSEKYVWARTGFKLKPFSRPAGALPWFSVVIDPYMPLRGSNLFFLKWRVQEQGDALTVWVKILHEELFRRGYLASMHEKIEEQLSALFPRFSQDLVAAVPFEEYFELMSLTHDDLGIVYNNKFFNLPYTTRFKNMWNVGPEHDRSLYLMSGLHCEQDVLKTLSNIRAKELKRDRKVHPPRDGRPLDANQAV